MALRDSFELDFLKEINRVAKAPVSLEQAIFSPTEADDENPRFARLRFTFKKEAIYRGSEILRYRRLNLEDFNHLFARLPNVHPSGNTLHKIIPDIQRYLGINLDPMDFSDTPVVEQNGVFYVDLIPEVNSPRWYNNIQLAFEPLPALSRVVVTPTILW